MGALRGYLQSLDGQTMDSPLYDAGGSANGSSSLYGKYLYSESAVGRVSFASKVVLRRAYAVA
jgi:hypothetical protein